jgi:hypothetical protein
MKMNGGLWKNFKAKKRAKEKLSEVGNHLAIFVFKAGEAKKLLKLERRYGPGGTDSVSHGTSPFSEAQDDLVFAAAGATLRTNKHSKVTAPRS